MKNIIWISNDGDLCYDTSCTMYTVNDVQQMSNTNVKVVNVGGKSKIVSLGSNYSTLNNKYLRQYVYDYGKITTVLYVIIEDKGSANKLIIQILERYAKLRKIKLICNILICAGSGMIATALTYYVPNNSYSLLIYDEDLYMPEYSDVINILKQIKKNNNKSCVCFCPTCIEECALSFKGLLNDIKGINGNQLELLNSIQEYLKTGKPYYVYDASTFEYNINNNKINFNTIGTITKKVINSMERYLAESLAEITFGKAYWFKKSVSFCWLNNCKSKVGICAFDEFKGVKHPDKKEILNCRKSYLNKDKLSWILKESMFGGLMDSLDMLFGYNISNYYLCKKLRDIIIKGVS